MQPTAKITVPEAAKVLGVTPQFLRMGLQQGRFPEFGKAVKFKRWAYFIHAGKFYDYAKGKGESKCG
jgi:hypothetical protein